MNSPGFPVADLQAEPISPFTVEPLGEEAVLIRHTDCGTIASVAGKLRGIDAPWKREIVPSYRSLAVFLDRDRIGLEGAIAQLKALLKEPIPREADGGTVWRVACCYDRGPDLDRIASDLSLSVKQVIEAHCAQDYTIFAIGFQPGFPYAGWLPTSLEGLPRLASPRPRVEPGSVGITGKQTGIYPNASPGGWNLLGQTPCSLVDLEKGWFAFTPGDRIRFHPIRETEWSKFLGQPPQRID